MSKQMSKTEAAEILATRIVVDARRHGWTVDKNLVEEMMGEAVHWTGLYPAAAAARPSWRTVLHRARQMAL